MYKIQRILKIIGIIFALVMVIVFSEVIYYFKNPHSLFPLTTSALQKFAVNGQISIFNQILTNSAKLVLIQNKNKYPEVIPSNYEVATVPTQDNEFNTKVANYYSTDNKNWERKNDDLSFVYYQLALMTISTPSETFFPNFLETAFYLNPTLSYWPIELANYYYRSGDPSKGLKILETCKRTSPPYEYCQKYLEILSNNGEPYQIGFLKQEIEEYYSSYQPPLTIDVQK